jgi:hypothetical protein
MKKQLTVDINKKLATKGDPEGTKVPRRRAPNQ